jgi:hypothetical protein
VIQQLVSPHADFVNMAPPATADPNTSGSPESADSSSTKPKQASRSVSLLTPEQLQRKRAQDRESQRQTRPVNLAFFPSAGREAD